MADVIDIIHNLSYTADTSVIEAISKQFAFWIDINIFKAVDLPV